MWFEKPLATLPLLLCRSRMGQMELERQAKEQSGEVPKAVPPPKIPSTFCRTCLSTNCSPGLNQTGQHTVPSAVLFLGPMPNWRCFERSSDTKTSQNRTQNVRRAEQLQRQWSQHRQRSEEPRVAVTCQPSRLNEWHIQDGHKSS